MYTDVEPLFTGRAGAASFTGVVIATAATSAGRLASAARPTP